MQAQLLLHCICRAGKPGWSGSAWEAASPSLLACLIVEQPAWVLVCNLCMQGW